MVGQFLPYPLAFVGFAVIADDEYGLGHDNREIRLQRLPFLDCLRFAHDYHLASSHHRKTPCSSDNRRDIRSGQITSVKDLLVKLPRHLIQGILRNKRIHPVAIIGFFAAEDINRRISARLQRAHDIIELLDHRSLIVGR